MGVVRIGTSGWNYRHWRARYYPKELANREWLAYYAARFNSVEINSSFYRLPSVAQINAWRSAVGEHFQFAYKASRYLTHMKKLTDHGESLEKMLDNAVALGSNLGPILFQLPPHWHVNLARLERFLMHLPTRHCKLAFEFRDLSWQCSTVFDCLKAFGVSNVLYDLNGQKSVDVDTGVFRYVRLHGPDGAYSGSYSDKQLGEWASLCRDWLKQEKDVYVYFDNDEAAYAIQNAATLSRRLDSMSDSVLY